MSCPEPQTLARYADGALDDGAAEQLRSHLEGCATCRAALLSLVRARHPTPVHPDRPLEPGTSVGGYRVTALRGTDERGVVLDGFDPQLERDVALRVLRSDDGEGAREAQQLARLRHPNVASVHDVLTEQSRVVIVMEPARAPTLRSWLASAQRSSAEILEVFRAAGRGLLAVHEAGVVHRHFTSDAVLMSTAGAVVVPTFGLTAGHVDATTPSGSEPLTWMAPEQLAGAPVDARSDQYSFCAALFEALSGLPPFEGETALALLASMRAGRQRPLPPTLPPTVARALKQGLSTLPASRFASMKDLLVALEPEPSRLVSATVIAFVVAILLVAAGVTLKQTSRCRPTRQRIDAIWPLAKQRALIERLSPSVGNEQAQLISDELARVTEDLRQGWYDVCLGTSDEDMRSSACLEPRVTQAELVASVIMNSTIDARAARALAGRLENAADCRGADQLDLAPFPSDAAARQSIVEARLGALNAEAARLSGRGDEALALALRAVELARQSGWRPVEAEALLVQAQALRGRGKYEDADRVLTEAAQAAEVGRHPEASARIAMQHALVLGTLRPDDADASVQRAEELLSRLPRPRLRGELDMTIALLAAARFEFERGLTTSERALGWAERFDPNAAAELHALRSLMLLQDGQHLAALDEARTALERRTVLFGATHPLTLQARLTLGEAQARAGLASDGVQTLTSALDEVRRRSDLTPTNAASGLAALAIALEDRGQPAEALVAATQARELIVSVLGSAHRSAALAERAVGQRLRAMGRIDEAIETLTKAIDLGTRAVGAEHPETLESRAELALTLAFADRRGAREEALAVKKAALVSKRRASNAQLTSALAIAFAPDATSEERAEAVSLARRLRGQPHPDLVRALLIEARAGDTAAGAEAASVFSRLQLVDAALAPLTLPAKL